MKNNSQASLHKIWGAFIALVLTISFTSYMLYGFSAGGKISTANIFALEAIILAVSTAIVAIWVTKNTARISGSLKKLQNDISILENVDWSLTEIDKSDYSPQLHRLIDRAISTEGERKYSDTEKTRLEVIIDASEIREMANLVGMMDLLDGIFNLAAGNLTVQLQKRKRGAMVDLNAGFNRSIAKLRGMFVEIRENTEKTTSFAHKIQDRTAELAAAAAEQSLQASDMATSISEMTIAIELNARTTTEASENTSSTGIIAQDGGRLVHDLVEKMEDIDRVVSNSAKQVETLGEASKEIGEIISVIDEIADQTNLLALNAAIEAARAGEQGRGFAVVADEVRQLAERTGKATSKITNMINMIQQETTMAVKAMESGSNEVTQGRELADEAGTALDKIVNDVGSVVDMVSQIATASEEQSTTSVEITNGIETMRQLSRESADGVDEIAGATHELGQQTRRLSTLVEQFEV